MKEIYIVFTRNDATTSRLIAMFTKGEFTHVSIALDRNLDSLYSFSRYKVHNPFRGGFIKESINKGLYSIYPTSRCVIKSLLISDESYEKIQNIINTMESDKEKYRYNYLGLLNFVFNKDFIRENKYFCSEFVSYVLEKSGAIKLHKPPSQTQPMDLMKISGLSKEYDGAVAFANRTQYANSDFAVA